MIEVERFRRNDYVGPAVWGLRTDAVLAAGDRVYFDCGFPTYRVVYGTITAEPNGRLAVREAEPDAWGDYHFVGYVVQVAGNLGVDTSPERV